MNPISDEKNRTVTFSGRLDAQNSNELDSVLSAIPVNGQDVIIDMSSCTYVSSTGIRVLLKLRKRMQSANADVYLTGVIPELMRVFEIAGLQAIFRFEANTENALSRISSAQSPNAPVDITVGHQHLIFRPAGKSGRKGVFYKDPGILSHLELGYAIGFGSLGSPEALQPKCTDFFASMVHCTGFVPLDQLSETDFRISSDPEKTGFPVNEVLSFGKEPCGVIRMQKPGMMTLDQLNHAIDSLRGDVIGRDSAMLRIILNRDRERPSLSFILQFTRSLHEIAAARKLDRLAGLLSGTEGNEEFRGITFVLSELPSAVPDETLAAFTSRHLSFENIISVERLQPGRFMQDPEVWLFEAAEFEDGNSSLLRIEYGADSKPDHRLSFLARLLYADSSRLELKELSGGYVASTFHVTSFDHEGRKMRPTVLKFGGRAVISRESDRCRQYAMPFIFNNCAVILGAEFYGETGALRYNFVGLGGDAGNLKWLTQYYQTAGVPELENLFDKIFTQILKPWYGQASSGSIVPFRDHDPTLTFFPQIYSQAKEILSVSADEEVVDIPELGRKALNPFWFLKIFYPEKRGYSMDYRTGICHGDLNMQNILLDENMNVHIIDFSETRPRSVISDFARLEVILLNEFIPLNDQQDLQQYVKFIEDFYRNDRMDMIPQASLDGPQREKISKNLALIIKLRKFALESAGGDSRILPYYLALLEWTLPMVCYSLSLLHKRLSMITSSLLCEKVRALMIS
jgi:anti-anti-sigma factor